MLHPEWKGELVHKCIQTQVVIRKNGNFAVIRNNLSKISHCLREKNPLNQKEKQKGASMHKTLLEAKGSDRIKKNYSGPGLYQHGQKEQYCG